MKKECNSCFYYKKQNKQDTEGTCKNIMSKNYNIRVANNTQCMFFIKEYRK